MSARLDAQLGNLRILCYAAAQELAPRAAEIADLRPGDLLLIPRDWPWVIRREDRAELAAAITPMQDLGAVPSSGPAGGAQLSAEDLSNPTSARSAPPPPSTHPGGTP